MDLQDVKQTVDEIRPALLAAGADIELMSVDEHHHYVLIKLILPPERCGQRVVTELRTLNEEMRRRNPSIRSVAIVEAPRDAT